MFHPLLLQAMCGIRIKNRQRQQRKQKTEAKVIETIIREKEKAVEDKF